MGRVIGSAVAGYVLVFGLVVGLMALAWMLMGPERALQPDSWNVTAAWAAASIVVGLVAAGAGGYATAALARDRRGPLVLVGIIIVLGFAFAIPVLTGGQGAAEAARTGLPSMGEAMQNGRQPVWLALVNPLLGAVGVLLGARLHGTPSGETA